MSVQMTGQPKGRSLLVMVYLRIQAGLYLPGNLEALEVLEGQTDQAAQPYQDHPLFPFLRAVPVALVH